MPWLLDRPLDPEVEGQLRRFDALEVDARRLRPALEVPGNPEFAAAGGDTQAEPGTDGAAPVPTRLQGRG